MVNRMAALLACLCPQGAAAGGAIRLYSPKRTASHRYPARKQKRQPSLSTDAVGVFGAVYQGVKVRLVGTLHFGVVRGCSFVLMFKLGRSSLPSERKRKRWSDMGKLLPCSVPSCGEA
ncbi:hypothetical protein B0T09DRAFT_47494 [Sordaria sp. MPI-SDFR-AT-0083]|nr:hypothetical protein B0T09DRAFT_47494 [Sordaria sp. MPI-SDFR-AT-0083]